MSQSTTKTSTAFIHTGHFNDSSRQHPVLKWFETYEAQISASIEKFHSHLSDYWTSDYTFTDHTGKSVSGRQDAYKFQIAQMVVLSDFFMAVEHTVITPITTSEGEDGYEMEGLVMRYLNLKVPGPPDSDKKAVDPIHGKTWDLAVPGGFRIVLVKYGDDEDGDFRIQSQRMFGESGPVIALMVQRGMVKAEDVGAA